MTSALATGIRTTSPLVVSLHGGGLAADLVGGKGAGLDRLIAQGFPVPACAVLTTECFGMVARAPEIADLVRERQSGRTPTEHVADDSAAVDEVFLRVPLPAPVLEAISEAAALVTSEPGMRLAVRSSATVEDMASMSFAGQYRSYLDVGTGTELERAVRLVWASLWHPAPTAYRRFHGVDESDLAMAVVVMPMVPARRAGVAFSRDPALPDEVRVETVSGLGESLVSGAVTPGVTCLQRASVSGPHRADDPVEVQVARLTLRAEELLGEPQDVEWAWDGHSVTLLQARPIAMVAQRHDDGFDTATARGARWTTAGVAETLPGTLPPLRWATARFILEEAFLRLFDELGALPDLAPSAVVVGRFRARAALSLDVLEQMAAVIPGGSPADVERQYFGRASGDRPFGDRGERTSRLRAARHDLAMLRVRRRSSLDAEIVRVATQVVLDAEPDRQTSLEETMRARQRLLDLGGRAMAAEVAVAASAVASYHRLESWLLRRFNRRDAERWAQRLTSRPGTRVWWQPLANDVAALAREGMLFGDDEGWQVARARLLTSADGRAVHDALLEGARRAGSMAVFAGPTWDEDLDRAWDLVLTAARSGGHRPPAPTVVDDGTAPMWEDFARALDSVSHSASRVQLVDRRLLTARRLVDDAVELLDRRETSKAAMLALGGQLRRIHLELGRRLCADDLLDRPEDVELLDEPELHAAVLGRCPSRAELGRRRRWLEQCRAEEPIPERFTGTPTRRRVEVPSGTELHGWGAGAGVHTGIARVVRHPSDPLGDGEVLVASSTDASWSPLFMRAGAIAVERGGPLSHAAIVARELGIPAVLNVPGLVAFLDQGAPTVTVDGDNGLITVLGGSPGATPHDGGAGADRGVVP